MEHTKCTRLGWVGAEHASQYTKGGRHTQRISRAKGDGVGSRKWVTKEGRGGTQEQTNTEARELAIAALKTWTQAASACHLSAYNFHACRLTLSHLPLITTLLVPHQHRDTPTKHGMALAHACCGVALSAVGDATSTRSMRARTGS